MVPLVLVPEVEPTRPLGALPGVALGLIAGRAGHFPLSLLSGRLPYTAYAHVSFKGGILFRLAALLMLYWFAISPIIGVETSAGSSLRILRNPPVSAPSGSCLSTALPADR